MTPASRLTVIIHHCPPLLLLFDLKARETSDICMQKTWRRQQMEGRRWKEKLKGAESHWVQRTQGADQLFNSGAWSLICMFLMAWRHSSRSSPQHLPGWTTGAWVWYPWWLTERKPWFMLCLLLAYSCLTEGGSVMSKLSWTSRFWTDWSDSIGSALCVRHQVNPTKPFGNMPKI